MIRFYKHRYIYFAISLCLILLGVGAAFINGIQLDIQFKGGTILKYTYSSDINAEQAEKIVEQAVGRTVNCQLQSNMAQDHKILMVSLASNEALSSREQEAVTSALTRAYPDASLALSESLTVEPFIGKHFFTNGMIAIALSFLLILVYVGWRFKNIGGLSAGSMAIIALFHDVFIVTAVFIIFKIPLNDSFIAAILTIIGFSINDTIVIYDRIRENERLLGRKTPAEELVDISINQSMSRSINTNIAVFMSIAVIYVFAQVYDIGSIRAFALPMMFGTISGCYSTICIAGPLWTMWQHHKKTKIRVKSAEA
ncbi:preprotein translocase subunit SecF [Pelotomaculum schinkii]|uniref:Protein-export membrane protein SecF n=1 Tax=Pelotomaculum schinkii TaxID=78350 RepID=A0A4Y7R7A6_9FIRM|nr:MULTISPECIES: protein translocase subunit SecF [Pelotomaculum]TEB04838.1 preprotein translocase subunit SecF [Pelotomaculum schinkii]TEB13974.1 preprotein translocase subunit SecF [Pelotomaculum sp. FP]